MSLLKKRQPLQLKRSESDGIEKWMVTMARRDRQRKKRKQKMPRLNGLFTSAHHKYNTTRRIFDAFCILKMFYCQYDV